MSYREHKHMNCMVLCRVIEEFKAKSPQNPCSICPYAEEFCLEQIAKGYVPLTGDLAAGSPEPLEPPTTPQPRVLKSTPKKKKKTR